MITSLGLLVNPHSSSYASYTNTIGNRRTCFLCPIDGDHSTTRKLFREKISESLKQQGEGEERILNCLEDTNTLVDYAAVMRNSINEQPTLYQWNSLSETFTDRPVSSRCLSEFENDWDALFQGVYSLILNPRSLGTNTLYGEETNSENLKVNLERYLQHFSEEQINLLRLRVDPHSSSFIISIRNLTTNRIAIIDLPHILSNPFYLLESFGASLQSYMQNF